jgi:hypothetical protein
LLKIQEFKSDFYERFLFLMDNNLRPDNVMANIDSFREILSPNMDNHINRWQYPQYFYEWEENISVLESFVILRHAEVLNALEKNSISEFYLLPNPAKEKIIVSKMNANVIDNVSIEIYDVCGNKLKEENVLIVDDYQINIASLKTGIYFVKIIFNGRVEVLKFMKI